MGDFPAVRLHIVTGKGGTGKTTVAAAMGLALAAGGRSVLLAEVEGRQGIAQLFGTPPLPYEERRIASTPGGGGLYALAIDAEEALLDYLEMFYNLRRAGRALKRLGAVDFATTIAPGMRDVLLTGKVKEAVGRPDDGRRGRVYDAVVLDAPPTGRIARFLNVNTEVAGLARMGPIHGQAEGVMALLRSPATAVHIVTVLEDMPVQESVDAIEELTALALPVGGLVVNLTRDPILSPEDLARAAAGLDAGELRRALGTAGLPVPAATCAALADEARDHAVRVALEERLRTTLLDLGRPTYELPLLADGVDAAGLHALARMLAEQGVGAAAAPAGRSA